MSQDGVFSARLEAVDFCEMDVTAEMHEQGIRVLIIRSHLTHHDSAAFHSKFSQQSGGNGRGLSTAHDHVRVVFLTGESKGAFVQRERMGWNLSLLVDTYLHVLFTRVEVLSAER